MGPRLGREPPADSRRGATHDPSASSWSRRARLPVARSVRRLRDRGAPGREVELSGSPGWCCRPCSTWSTSGSGHPVRLGPARCRLRPRPAGQHRSEPAVDERCPRPAGTGCPGRERAGPRPAASPAGLRPRGAGSPRSARCIAGRAARRRGSARAAGLRPRLHPVGPRRTATVPRRRGHRAGRIAAHPGLPGGARKARNAINAVVAPDTAGLADAGVPRPARRRRAPPS